MSSKASFSEWLRSRSMEKETARILPFPSELRVCRKVQGIDPVQSVSGQES